MMHILHQRFLYFRLGIYSNYISCWRFRQMSSSATQLLPVLSRMTPTSSSFAVSGKGISRFISKPLFTRVLLFRIPVLDWKPKGNKRQHNATFADLIFSPQGYRVVFFFWYFSPEKEGRRRRRCVGSRPMSVRSARATKTAR